MSNSRQKRLEKAQMRVLFTVPFFAPGVAKLPITFVNDGSIDTAATDGQSIIWSQQFFDSLEDQQLVTVLCHEVAHCMLGHLWRAPSGCDWDLWNQATDHAVNLMLKDFSETVKAKRLADPFPFPQPETDYCADPAYRDMSEEVIYGKLASKQPQNGQGQAGKGGGSSGKGKGNKTSPGSNGAQKQGTGSGSMPDFGQILKPKPNPGASGQSSSKRLQNDWKATLMQAVEISQGRGDLPGSMARFVEALINPQVPWWELLRAFLREQAADDWNWLRPDPMFDESGFILPSLDSEKIGAVVFGSDWSGSTFGELVERFHAEKQNALDTLCPSKLIDIGFDTRVVWEKEYLPGEIVDKEIKGGGGTSFVDFFRRCSEITPAIKCAVVLTDLDGEFPKQEPNFPVLWVVFQKGCTAPFGQVIVAQAS